MEAGEGRNVWQGHTSKIITILHTLLTLVLSVLSIFLMYYANRLSNQANELSQQSLNLASLQATFNETSYRRRLILDTLKEMQQIQNELQSIQSKGSDSDNLSEKEILLLNYYEVLSKTLADNVNKEPSLLVKAQCNHPDSVRIRKKPSGSSEQIGGVSKDDFVTVLGTFSRSEEHKWYYVITGDNKIGWGYKYFSVIQ